MDCYYKLVFTIIGFLSYCKTTWSDQSECIPPGNYKREIIAPGVDHRLFSPYFPNFYLGGCERTWDLTTTTGYIIKLSCVYVNMPQPGGKCEDLLTVTVDDKRESKYCSPFVILGSKIKVHLTSTPGYGGGIFDCDVTSDKNPKLDSTPPEYCGSDSAILGKENKITILHKHDWRHNYQPITNPSFPKPYPSGSKCSWDLVTSSGYQVSLRCDNVNLTRINGACTDYLAVSTTGNIQNAEKYCHPFIAEGPAIKMQLISKAGTAGGVFHCMATSEPIPVPNKKKNCDCGWTLPTRIVGGDDADPTEFPSISLVVQLAKLPNGILCGATIIAKTVAITAGHCFVKSADPRRYGLVVDAYDITQSGLKNATVVPLNKIIIHRDYHGKKGGHDIALLVTAKEIEYSPAALPACLPFNLKKEKIIDKDATVTGFGVLKYGDIDAAAVLQKLKLHVLPEDKCKAAFPVLYKPRQQFCTFNSTGKDVCRGDSGSPIYYKTDGRQIVVGMVSFSRHSFCATMEPSVMLNVHYYLPWILNNAPNKLAFTIIGFLSHCKTTWSDQSECIPPGNYKREIIAPGEDHRLFSPYFPNFYLGGCERTWDLTTTTGYIIKLSCVYVNMPQPGGQCEDLLTVTVDKRESKYCSPFVILGSKIKVYLTSTPGYGGGIFDCDVTSDKNPTLENTRPGTCDCDSPILARISGGVEARINEFPATALIKIIPEERQWCGATIIARRVALTAGHCFIKDIDPRNFGLIVGEHDTSTNKETNATKLITISRIIVHPDFLPSKGGNDIALLKTTKDIEYSFAVGPACLPFYLKKEQIVGKYVTATGWGLLSFADTLPSKLQKVNLEIVPDAKCTPSYGSKYKPEQHMCSYTPGKDTCRLDSGNALYYFNDQKRYFTVVGVVSYGYECATKDPSLNINVNHYVPWILNQLPEVEFCIKQ